MHKKNRAEKETYFARAKRSNAKKTRTSRARKCQRNQSVAQNDFCSKIRSN